MPEIMLLHIIGEAPEGPWAVFSLPHGDGTQMVGVVVPRSLWSIITRSDPFSSEVSLMERVGRAAIERRLAEGRMTDPVWVEAADWEGSLPVERDWFRVLRTCGRCGQAVPPGEVLEGLANALPPDSRGEVRIKVLCPPCGVQTEHRLTPWGIPQS